MFLFHVRSHGGTNTILEGIKRCFQPTGLHIKICSRDNKKSHERHQDHFLVHERIKHLSLNAKNIIQFSRVNLVAAGDLVTRRHDIGLLHHFVTTISFLDAEPLLECSGTRLVTDDEHQSNQKCDEVKIHSYYYPGKLYMAKVERSSYPVKKFMAKSPKGQTIYFGQAGYGDYDLWSRVDPEYAEKKRYRYTTSHKAILLKDGTPAWKSPETAEFYASRALWNFQRGNPLFDQVVAIRNKSLTKEEKAFITKQKKLLAKKRSK